MRLTFRSLIIAITFICLLAMATRVAVDSDTWWHLRAGAWMVEHGRPLTQEVFTHTAAGRPLTCAYNAEATLTKPVVRSA